MSIAPEIVDDAAANTAVRVALEGVSLHVKDVEKSVAFYSLLPGSEKLIHRPGQFARFRIGNGYLHVVNAAHAQRFHVELTTADLSALHAHLIASGIDTVGPPTTRAWGKTDLRVFDPDGNLLEFDAPSEE